MEKDFSFEYGKKAEIFAKYIYDIAPDGREYIFTGCDSEEVKTALETFGAYEDPDTVLGLYSRDGGEEGVLFTTFGIISYMPSDDDFDITDFGDVDAEDCEFCDYCFAFDYADIKSISQVYYLKEEHFHTVPDRQMTVEITCKGKDTINFGLEDFCKSPLFSLISETAEFEKSLFSEESAKKTEPLIVITLINPAL